MNTKEKIAVMQHYADGGKVEVYNGHLSWEEAHDVIWNWLGCIYRIKPIKSQAGIAREEAVEEMSSVISTAVKGATVTINELHLSWLHDAGYNNRKQGEVVSLLVVEQNWSNHLETSASLSEYCADNYIITKRTDKGVSK